MKFKIIEKNDNLYRLRVNIPKIDPELKGQEVDKVQVKLIQEVVQGNLKLK